MKRPTLVKPNVVVERLALLLRIREVPGSNLARSSAILPEIFVVLLSYSWQMPE
jgi:hypothetical protein